MKTIYIRFSNQQWIKARGNDRRIRKVCGFMIQNFDVVAWQIMTQKEFKTAYKINPNSIPSLN